MRGLTFFRTFALHLGNIASAIRKTWKTSADAARRLREAPLAKTAAHRSKGTDFEDTEGKRAVIGAKAGGGHPMQLAARKIITIPLNIYTDNKSYQKPFAFTDG